MQPNSASKRFVPVTRTILAVQVVALSLACAVAAHAQDSPTSTGASLLAADCRASSDELAHFQGSPQWLDRSPRSDGNDWESLAAQRFMAGDSKGALAAWNRLGQPRIRCLNVEGLVRTPRSLVIKYLNTSGGQLLTPGLLTRLDRRLDELPISSGSRLRYDPVAGGVATITPIVPERRMIPQGIQGWGVVGVRAAFLQELQVNISSPTGRGEVWTPSYRWSPNRPRTMVRFEAPAPGRFVGMIHAQAFVESQTYGYPALGSDIFRQPRQRVSVSLSDWMASWLRWEGGTGFDRIDSRSYLALEGSLNARALGDRLAVIFTAGQWSSATDGASFSSGEFVVTARSTANEDRPVLTVLLGAASVTDSSPFAVWPGTSSGEGRNNLLRAHPLRMDSVITGDVFGRELVFGTTEFEYPVNTRVGPVGIAAFVDAARATRRLSPISSPFHVDIGSGVRFNASGAGKVRLDLGVGLRDGDVELSAGYAVPWGRR